MSNIVAQANEETKNSPAARVDTFLCTGCLLTLDGTDDNKIKPQGLTKALSIPTVRQERSSQAAIEPVTSEEQGGNGS